MTDAGIVQSMREAVRVVEHFGEADRAGETLRRFRRGARQLQRVATLDVRANAGIVTAEGVAEVTVAGIS